jgi:hypothetical protein
MEMLDKYLRQINPYCHAYKQMQDVQKEHELKALKEGIAIKKISMFFKKNTSVDQRRYNIPKIGEVAVVFDGEDGEPSASDIMIHPKPYGSIEKPSYVLNKINILVNIVIQ